MLAFRASKLLESGLPEISLEISGDSNGSKISGTYISFVVCDMHFLRSHCTTTAAYPCWSVRARSSSIILLTCCQSRANASAGTLLYAESPERRLEERCDARSNADATASTTSRSSHGGAIQVSKEQRRRRNGEQRERIDLLIYVCEPNTIVPVPQRIFSRSN